MRIQEDSGRSDRALARYREMKTFQDSDNHPYLHLVYVDRLRDIAGEWLRQSPSKYVTVQSSTHCSLKLNVNGS